MMGRAMATMGRAVSRRAWYSRRRWFRLFRCRLWIRSCRGISRIFRELMWLSLWRTKCPQASIPGTTRSTKTPRTRPWTVKEARRFDREIITQRLREYKLLLIHRACKVKKKKDLAQEITIVSRQTIARVRISPQRRCRRSSSRPHPLRNPLPFFDTWTAKPALVREVARKPSKWWRGILGMLVLVLYLSRWGITIGRNRI